MPLVARFIAPQDVVSLLTTVSFLPYLQHVPQQVPDLPPGLDPTDKEALAEHFAALAKGAADSIKWGREHYQYIPKYVPLIYKGKHTLSPKRRRKYLQQCGHNGGNARAAKLSPERRREIALLAAAARWKKS